MSLVFRQSATSETARQGCATASLGSGAVGRVCSRDGTHAGSATTINQPANTTAWVMLSFTTPVDHLGLVKWNAGTWTVRLNVTTSNMNVNLTAITICRLNSAGTSQQTIGTWTGAASLGSTGVITQTISGGAVASPAAGDRILVAYTFQNTTTMAQSFGVTSNQDIDTPLTPAAFTQAAYRFRNDDGNETGATWKAAQNTAINQQIGERLRVRARVSLESGAAGASAFQWQYARGVSLLLDTTGLESSDSYWEIGTTSGEVVQTVTLSAPTAVSKIALYLYKVGAPSDSLAVEVRNWLGTSSGPGSTIHAATSAVNAAAIPTFAGGPTYVEFAFPAGTVLPAGTLAVMPVRTGAVGNTHYYSWGMQDAGTYAGGQAWASSSDLSARDFLLRLYGVVWTALPAQAASSVPTRYADSPSLTDAAATTQQLGSGTFRAGRVYESAHATTVTFSGGDETELEAVLELVTGQVNVGDQLQFRVVRSDGTALSTYSQTPTLTVASAPGAGSVVGWKSATAFVNKPVRLKTASGFVDAVVKVKKADGTWKTF